MRTNWFIDERSDAGDDLWSRFTRALRRDWEQTKYDLDLQGINLRQGLSDTIKQALGIEPIPRGNRPNPRRCIVRRYSVG